MISTIGCELIIRPIPALQGALLPPDDQQDHPLVRISARFERLRQEIPNTLQPARSRTVSVPLLRLLTKAFVPSGTTAMLVGASPVGMVAVTR